ncbi:MAG TPA: glycosyltransferase [Acidobacteriaceae bacterium]|nr:glycosyltransferase [Acidobacteriaceae bacterium]
MQVLIVVVRYKTPLEDSQTMASLSRAFARDPELLGRFGVLVWDNSPIKLKDPRASFPFEYRYSDQNLGVSGAYNRAMESAESIGCPWLLLLDQDTTIPEGFLEAMLAHSHELQGEPRIATIVPFVRSHGTLISPRQFGRFLRSHQIPRSESGVFKKDAYAVNSGTLMRVSALREVGGYSEDFWLDLSDAYIFQALYRMDRWMYIAGDLELPHSLAAQDFNKDMGTERYRNFLAAENTYIQLYRSRAINWLQTFWLAARALRQYRRYENKDFARITFACFIQRLTSSKSSRLKRWLNELQQREIPAISNGRVVG